MLLINNLEFAYSSAEKWRFSFKVPDNRNIAILGASGIGKSTLLNLIAGFQQPLSGDIIFNQQRLNDLPPAQRPISMLFQENNLFEHLTVKQNIGLGLNPSLKLSAQQLQSIEEILEKVSLANKLDVFPNDLSTGQRQRVALARCLLRNKPLLLLDEPFSALDQTTREELMRLVKEFQHKQNATVLLLN